MPRSNLPYFDEAEIEADSLREYYQPLLRTAEEFVKQQLGDVFDGFVIAYGCYKRGSFEFYWEHPIMKRTIVCSGCDNDDGRIDAANSECWLEEEDDGDSLPAPPQTS